MPTSPAEIELSTPQPAQQEEAGQAHDNRTQPAQQEEAGQAHDNRSFRHFVPPGRSGAIACVVLLIVACIVLVAVLPPVCVLKGCGAGRQREGAGAEPVNRLIVNFNATLAKSVKERVPVLLHSFFEEAILQSSGIHVVSFADAVVLEEVRRLLLKEPDLANVLQDSAQSRVPRVDGLAGLGGGGGGPNVVGRRMRELRRRSMQAGDEQFSGPDALYDKQFPYPYGVSYVNAMGAWNITQGAPEIIVAVIDTGCDLEHPDLKDNLWVNDGEIPGNNMTDDINEYKDDVHGLNFAGPCESDYPSGGCGPQPSPQDLHGHGTHCAGIVAAVRNNSIGIAGIAPNVKIMCLKVVPPGGSFYIAHNLKAINYAVQMGAHIVSCSFGPSAPNLLPNDDDKANALAETNLYKAALAPLVAKNMLIVAAAGNEDTDLDRLEALGTNYNPCTLAANANFSSNMLCVMATNERDVRFSEFISNELTGSNYGLKHVNIGAPGRNIWSTVPNISAYHYQHWDFMWGTSQATPLVAGVGALVMSVLGKGDDGGFFRGKEARRILMESAHRPAAGPEALPISSGGRVDAASAVIQAFKELRGIIFAQPLAGFVRSAQSVVAEGLAATYYDADGTVLDRGVRITPVQSGAVSRFDSYKRSTDCTLVIKAILELPLSDFYKIQVSTRANATDLAVLVGQKSLNLATGAVNTIVSAGGFYEFELRYRNPSAPIDITVTEPSGQPGAAPQQGARFFIATAEEPKHYYYAPDIALSSAFQVLTRPPPSGASNVDPSLLLQLDQKYSFSSVVEDLNFSRPGELASALYPAAVLPEGVMVPAAVVGLVHARLRAPERAMRFRVTCAACWLSVNGLLLLDVYDAHAPGSPATRLSSCVDHSTSAAATHDLLLRFSLTDTAAAVLMLAWLPCDPDGDPNAPAAPLTSHVMNNLLWKPASGVAGYLPGMQCDVWADPTNHPPYPYLTAPLVKFRLPTALAHTAKGRAKTLQGATVRSMYNAFARSGCNGSETANSSCSASVAFKLTDLAFSQAANTTLLGSAGLDNLCMRCWTYINRGYRSGNMQPLPSTDGPTILGYLGSQQIFSTDGDSSRISLAPNVTSFPVGYYQLLAMEWRSVSAIAVVGIVDGTNSSSDFLQLDMRHTLLPIPVVAQRDASALVFDDDAVAADAGGTPLPPGPSPPSAPRPSRPSWPTRPSRPSSPPTAPTATATTATTSITNATFTPTSTPSNTTTNTTSASVSERRSRSLLQLRPNAGGYRPQALGASAYSLAQVSDPSSEMLQAGIYSPNAALFNESFPFLGTFVLNNINSINISMLESHPSKLGLAGVLPDAAPAPVSKARYVRAAGFVRPPSTDVPGSRSMRTWHVRVRDLADQALTVTLGNVTLRNGVEFPSVSLTDTLTEVTLPPGWVPVVVVLRSQRKDVAGEFSVSLLDPAAGGAETKVNGSYWSELKPV